MIDVRVLFFFLLTVSLAGCYIVVDDDRGWTDSYGYDEGYDGHYVGSPWIDTSQSGWYCEDFYQGGTWNNYWEFYALAGDSDGIKDILSVDVYVYDYYGYEVYWAQFGYPSDWYGDSGAHEAEFIHVTEFSHDRLPCSEWHDIEYVVEDDSGNIVSYWIY